MIRILDGTRETVDFQNNSTLLLYNNVEYEEYPLHWHTPIEIIMPQEEGYSMDCSGVHYDLRVNDIILIAPGVLHHLYAHTGRRIVFLVDLKMIHNIETFESFFSIINPAIVITPEDFPDIHSTCVTIMNEIYDEYFSNSQFSNVSIVSKFLNMLVLLGRAHTASSSKAFTNNKVTKQQEYTEKLIGICDYINLHCTEDLSLEDIATKTGFSKYHFSRLFKDFVGTSFYKYLNERRIDYATNLLLDQSISITEVAVNSGFNSISAFMRMFKIIKGCTPTQFRSLNSSLSSSTVHTDIN